MNSRALVWIRRDLRLQDHRALYEATRNSKEVQVVFIIDDRIVGDLPRDDRRVTFIQGCLDELDRDLRKRGSSLLVQRGNPIELIPKIARELGAQAVYTNRDYDPAAKRRDQKVEKALSVKGIALHTFKDQVIFERLEVASKSGEPYKVFTPYSRTWLKTLKPARDLQDYKPDLKRLLPLKALTLKSTSFFEGGFKKRELSIPPGSQAAQKILRNFAGQIAQYHLRRDFPAVEGTSHLSVHLRFGTISIRECVRFCRDHLSPGAKTWLKELIWRDFYQMILDQYPQVVDHAFKAQYDRIKWPGTRAHFKAWCEGRTGYPIVDAAMRQLNQTGWMHNRLRMVTAMFLTKDLLVDWRWGERYFAQQLLDYDLASNNGGWQWAASTGCDAQPYFRIFNPDLQAKKFDRETEFVHRYVPEVDTSKYPAPIVDHAVQRIKAFRLFKSANH